MKADQKAYLEGEDGKRVFGPGPAELLERVSVLGSLHAASIEMGMAYTKATRIIRDAEAAFGFRLTERKVGGAGGGGSELTPAAADLVRRYRAFQRASEADLKCNYDACFAGFGDVPKLGCVVLAGGAGARFGGSPGAKLMVRLDGVHVLERTLEAIPRELFDIVVVTRWTRVESLCDRLGVSTVEPDGPLQSDSVRAGLAALGERAGIMFVPGDQPLLTRKSVVAMAEAFRRSPHSVVRLSWRGRPGSPVLWPRDYFGPLSELEGDAGGARLLAAPEAAGQVRLVAATDAAELEDVDTKDALAFLEGALKRREIAK